MEGDIIRHLIQLVHLLHHVDVTVQPQGGIHRQEGVVAVDVHPQVQGDIANQGPDGPQTDHPQGLAVELRSGEGGLSLFHSGSHVHLGGVGLLLDPVRAAQDVPGGDEHGGDHQLLHCVGVGAGGVEDHNPALGTAVDGDVVGPCPRPGDGPEGIGELISVHRGGTDQDAVLLLHIAPHLEAVLIQLGQAHRGYLVQGLDTVHRDHLGSCFYCRSSFIPTR